MQKHRNEQNINKSTACAPAEKNNTTTALYMIVAGPYNEPCLFDGVQCVRDDFDRGNSVPLYDQETAARLIERANAFRLANGHEDARYRMVPVFEMTIIND